MIRVGLTGNIGSGKSTVARLFAMLRIPVYDSDSEAKRLMQEHDRIRQFLSLELGPEAFISSGQLNRPFLASHLFTRPELLRAFNALLHPLVYDDFEQWAANQLAPYVVLESAILFESGGNKQLDKVVLVSAPESLRMERVLERDKTSREAVQYRMNLQEPENQKINKADYVIRNYDGEALIPQVLAIHQSLTEQKANF